MKEILTKHLHIFNSCWNYLNFILDIALPDGRIIYIHMVNHKIIEQDIWKLN